MEEVALSGWVRAGFLYFAIVFLAGFALGTLRVLVIAPLVGKVTAVLGELPVMLAISWFACRFVVDRISVPPKPGPRAAMGLFAFVLVMIAESCLAVFVFGQTITEHLQAYLALDAILGLAAQLLFASFPVAQISRRSYA
jgi:hypothetical protein